MTIRATYDPTENKLRLYPSERLDHDTYLRVKAAGFSWAPQQKLFVAPMWTPEREDLACELADSGELEDEDTTLAERAEVRAERFEDYQTKRAEDAERTHETAETMAEDLAPAGGVIGRGNWRAARKAHKDAERLKATQAKAVKLWETSEYWERRAKGAIAHAKYKELPGVRARRIQTLEADERRFKKSVDENASALAYWMDLPEGPAEEGKPSPAFRRALFLANYGIGGRGAWSDMEHGKRTLEDVRAEVRAKLPLEAAHDERWLAHIGRRLTYERTLLAADGYVEPVKTRTKRDLGPMCNWPAPGHVAMTKGEMKARYHEVQRHGGRNGQPVYRQYGTSAACVPKPIFLTDVKRKDPPTAEQPKTQEATE